MTKRLLDIIVSILLLVLLFPLMALLAIMVRFSIGGPVLFTQTRPGLNGELFRLYKFRTMRTLFNLDDKLTPDADRISSLGMLMRQWSLDELPELFNVLRGDMSLVGPRPLLPQYLERYTPEQARRHEVRPGLTGWAQVNGRNAITWEEKFALDVWYVDHQSFWLDLKILALTIVKVFRREGISADGEETMPEFMGSEMGSGKKNVR